MFNCLADFTFTEFIVEALVKPLVFLELAATGLFFSISKKDVLGSPAWYVLAALSLGLIAYVFIHYYG